MENIQEYREILELINIIILISVTVLSTFMFFLYKNISFIILVLTHSMEIGVSIYCTSYLSSNLINRDITYLISLMFITKVIVLTLFYKKINFKAYLNFLLIVGYTLAVLSLSSGYEISIVISIILNLLIVNLGIIDKIKNVKRNLNKNRHKLKLNRRYISKAITEMELESNLKYNLNEKVKTLNNKIENTIETLNLPVFILNNQGDFIYGNREFETFLKEDNIDPTEIDIIAYFKDRIKNFDEMINNIKYAEDQIDEFINIYTYDDKVFKFICTLDVINNKILKICILENITNDIKMKTELKESEERYRKLMNILNDGVIIHNIDTVSYINDKALELFNIDNKMKKVLLIDDIKGNINKENRKKFIKGINLVRIGKEEKIINKIETEDGKIIEFMTTSITLNNTPMMLSIAIDITDLENAKSQLEESEKTYKLLLQTLPEGIVIIDKKTKVHTYRNKSMIKMLKYIGSDRFNEIVKEYMKDENFSKFKKFSIKEDKNINLSMSITDSKEDNNLVCVVSVLDNEYRAEQMIEKLNEMKDKYKFKTEFLYTISTNLKKPINTIFEVNKILQNNKSKYDFKYIDNYARVVKQNSYRLKRLLNNIEEISKVENGILEMNYRRCDVVKFVENIVKLSREYAKDKNLEILFITNIQKKVILIDKDKIEKILLNLLSNSIKFTNNNGKIMVSINSNKEEVIISVEDTGVGIPDEKMDAIFENFEQVDTTLSRGAEGTGVGLALVKKLAYIHNAKINVYSKIGYGSKFEIILENSKASCMGEEQEESINTDIEKIDIEFSDIYFDIGS